MKSEAIDAISLRRGAEIIGVGTRAYNSRRRSGLAAPVVELDGREVHERKAFKAWLEQNAIDLGWENDDPRLLAMIEKLGGVSK